MNRREAILAGISRAAELHEELGLRKQLRDGNRPVDVISALHLVGLVILFRPLKGLLGAYIPDTPVSGVLITTDRSLHIQRLTAAHELGHHLLNHTAPSLDKEQDIGFVGRGSVEGHDLQEVEADAFAIEFMLPRWLIVSHAKKRSWGKSELRRPEIVYQLSLRLGASYSATCWALFNSGILSRRSLDYLMNTSPKSSKQKAAPDINPENWRMDVWELSEHDAGSQLIGSSDDYLVLALQEHVAAGYAWDTTDMHAVGLRVCKDERHTLNSDAIGAPVARRLVAHGTAVGRLKLEERRKWEAASVSNKLELDLALMEPQKAGLPRFLPICNSNE